MAERTKRDRTINYVRASISHGRGRKALDEIRQTSSIGSVKGIVTVAYRVPNTARYPVLAQLARDTKWLLSFTAYRALPFSSELEWALCQIERWSEVIKNFVENKNSLQTEVLHGNWAAAKQRLGINASAWGVSGWSITANIAILQRSDGQEVQKEFARRVIAESTGLPVGIAHLCSQRNEDAVSISGYIARADDTISEWGLTGDWAFYLRWIVLGSTPASLDEANCLLRVGGSGSVIDLYEATVAAVTTAVDRRGELVATDQEHLIRSVLRLGVFNDPRVSSLGVSLGLDGVLPAKSAAGEAFRAVVTVARSADELSSVVLFDPLVKSLRSVSNRLENAKSEWQELGKMALAFDFLPVGPAISAYADSVAERGHFPYGELNSTLTRLLGDPVGRIWDAAPGAREYLMRQLEQFAEQKDVTNVQSVCAELEKGDRFEVVAAAKARFELAMGADNWWDALVLAVNCLARFPGAAYEFALAEVLASRGWAELKPKAETLELGISLSYALMDSPNEATRQRLHRHLQQSAIRILKSRKVPYFSDLAKTAGSDALMKCFLREACSESVMEVNTNIRSSRALSEERMKVCQELSVIDEAHGAKYLHEIKQITFGLELEEGVRHFDSSRLFVNTEGLNKWAHVALAEDFSRYLSLRGSALPDAAEIQAALLTIQMGEQGSVIPPILLEKPKTESERLLTEIVQKLSKEFYTSPVFGLNAFLSLRIRHGSLAGHLRGPLEELAVIASKREDGDYAPIDRWASTKSSLNEPNAADFDALFAAFSEKVDTKIARIVDELLQIRSDSKPYGAFEDSVSLILINALKGGLTDTANLSDLVDACVTHFKVSLEPTLERIRHEIGQVLKDQLDQLLQELMVDLEVLSTDQGLIGVLDALGRARTNFAFAVDRVAQWFRPLDKEASDRTYSIEQIIGMGEKLTTNARPTFQPHMHVEIDSEIPKLGAQSGAFLIADALFIVFDNVYLHSGVENPVDISVRVSVTEESFLAFKIENEVTMINFAETSEKLDRIRAQLHSGEFRKRAAGEGGTGFFKLRRLGEAAAFEGRSNIEFDLTEEKFTVNLLVPLLLREVYEEALDETLGG